MRQLAKLFSAIKSLRAKRGDFIFYLTNAQYIDILKKTSKVVGSLQQNRHHDNTRRHMNERPLGTLGVFSVPFEHALRTQAKMLVNQKWFRELVSFGKEGDADVLYLGHPSWGIKAPVAMGVVGLQLGAGALHFKKLGPTTNHLLRELASEVVMALTDAYSEGRAPSAEELKKAQEKTDKVLEHKMIIIDENGAPVAHDARCVSPTVRAALKGKTARKLTLGEATTMDIPFAEQCDTCRKFIAELRASLKGGSMQQEEKKGEKKPEKKNLSAGEKLATLLPDHRADLDKLWQFFEKWRNEGDSGTARAEAAREVERIIQELDPGEALLIADALGGYDSTKKVFEHYEKAKMLAQAATKPKTFMGSMNTTFGDAARALKEVFRVDEKDEELVELKNKAQAAKDQRAIRGFRIFNVFTWHRLWGKKQQPVAAQQDVAPTRKGGN